MSIAVVKACMQPLARAKPSKRRFRNRHSTPLPFNLGTADLMLLVSRDHTARLLPLAISTSSATVCSSLLVVTPTLLLVANSACPLVPIPSKPVGGSSPPAEASCSSPASRLASIADSLSSKGLVCDESRPFKSSMVSWSPNADQPTSSSNFSLTYSMTMMSRRRSSNNSPELCA